MSLRTSGPIYDLRMYVSGSDFVVEDSNDIELYRGTNAVTIFNNATTYLNGLGGGDLLVLGGIYTKTGATAFQFKNFVNVDGCGWKTKFTMANGVSGNVMECVDQVTVPEPTGFYAGHFHVHGNKDNCPSGLSGIYIHNSPEIIWHDIWCTHCYLDGMNHFGEGLHVNDESTIERCFFYFNRRNGLSIETCNDMTVQNCVMRQNGYVGTTTGGGMVLNTVHFSTFVGNKMLSNYYRGGLMYGCWDNTFYGNHWRNNNADGLAMQLCSKNQFFGDIYDVNSGNGIALYDGLVLYDGCYVNTFVACIADDWFGTPRQRVGFYDSDAGNFSNKLIMCTAIGNVNYQIIWAQSNDINLYPYG